MKKEPIQNAGKSWSVKDSENLYQIDKWGDKYFSINKYGNVCVSTDSLKGKKIDLLRLVRELKSREINPPFVLRFNDILKDRILELNQSFSKAIKTYQYKNIYQGVYPIKCNQQKNLLEKIVEFGDKWNFGLEVGSKSELLIGLSLLKNKKSLLICNGYKDKNYIEIAILARKLGRNPIIVIEQIDDVKRIIKAVKDLGATPMIGIRTKLSSRSSGRWRNSSGDKSKFGLSIPEIMHTINQLKNANLLNELKLLHFHIGSQISNIKIIKDSLQEASQIFVELSKFGANMQFIDVGGGLGVDYDGSKTSTNNSTNYSMQNYANDVVATLKDSCITNNIPEPVIISESGRSITSHFSILIFNILGTSNITHEFNYSDQKHTSLVINNLIDTLFQLKKMNKRNVDIAKIIELWNDAKKFKEDALTSFRLGFITLEERAYAEQITSTCAKEITRLIETQFINHSDLVDIKTVLASTYYGNFSVFQSIPDSWAINQVFPTIPIHRHTQKPNIKGTFADLTCDSDGKLDSFMSDGHKDSLINLHEKIANKDYFIGIFLSGAYQETLGNLHNLFGNTNVIHIDIEEENQYKISEIIKEDNKSEILELFDYNPNYLVELLRLDCESAIKRKKLSIKESHKLLTQIESSLRNSTYLSG